MCDCRYASAKWLLYVITQFENGTGVGTKKSLGATASRKSHYVSKNAWGLRVTRNFHYISKKRLGPKGHSQNYNLVNCSGFRFPNTGLVCRGLELGSASLC